MDMGGRVQFSDYQKFDGERVAVPDLHKVIKSLCLDEDNPSWGPNLDFGHFMLRCSA
jgi:hypothetical protein